MLVNYSWFEPINQNFVFGLNQFCGQNYKKYFIYANFQDDFFVFNALHYDYVLPNAHADSA